METPDGVEVHHEPHLRYPDWPGRTTIYFKEGSAKLENISSGAHLFIRVSGQEYEHNACLTLEETEFLYEQLGFALEEQRQLVAKERELSDW